ncbi:MAG TPA: cytochrome c maturation protein CcmE [Alphaproteobacteria bacterium]|nr:cytochrome c maturation protein CcmE [Alphaproteobacteria bacterium]
MTRKKRRLMTLSLAGLGLFTATALALAAFQDNLVFFYSPSDVQAKTLTEAQRFRLGGLVEPGSLAKLPDGISVTFKVTDGAAALPVAYTGILPDLFREGQGVVAEGSLGPDGVFKAKEILAKHDENYMPPEVAEALKKSGHFKPEAQEAKATP